MSELSPCGTCLLQLVRIFPELQETMDNLYENRCTWSMLAFAEVGQDPAKPPNTKQGDQVTRVECCSAASAWHTVLGLAGQEALSQAGMERRCVSPMWACSWFATQL